MEFFGIIPVIISLSYALPPYHSVCPRYTDPLHEGDGVSTNTHICGTGGNQINCGLSDEEKERREGNAIYGCKERGRLIISVLEEKKKRKEETNHY